MTIEEIAQSLPNGFHDSSIAGVRLDYVKRTAEIDMELWFSEPDEADQEKYRPATLFISELIYFVIEAPGYPTTCHAEPSLVDGGSSEVERSTSQLPKPLPGTAFTYWFFVNSWNSFIHVAALSAEIGSLGAARILPASTSRITLTKIIGRILVTP
jgi:hypothetical protein